MPKVSIIVPNYNYARFLPERMESIFSQTFQDFEIILLDDCSTDNSCELLTEYAKHEKVTHCVFNEKNSGSPFAQWDKGIQLAQGEWIWIAEADDVANIHFLEKMLAEVVNYPSAGLAYSQLQAIGADGQYLWTQPACNNKFYTGIQFVREKLVFTTTIFNVSCCVFKKSDYKKIDTALYQQYRHGGDYMFYIQMAGVTDVYECGQILDSFRIHKTSTSHSVTINGRLEEGFPILKYLKKTYRIPQIVYAMEYARQEYANHYSKQDLKRIMSAYCGIGMWMVPICYMLYSCYEKTYGFWHFFTRLKNWIKRTFL